jgi:uncharacterized protein
VKKAKRDMSDMHSTEEKQPRAAEEQTRLDEVLREACREGRDSLVRHMLAKGAKPSAQNKSGRNALMMATECEPETLQALLALCDVDAQDRDGWTVLMFAAYAGLDETVEALLAAGANAKAVDHNGASALHMAAIQGSAYAAAAVARASDLDQVNALGQTAEQTAIERGHGGVAEAIARERARREREALSEAAGSPAPECQKTRKARAL